MGKITPADLEKFYFHVDELCEDIFSYESEDYSASEERIHSEA